MSTILELKEQGNKLFLAGDCQKAIVLYSEAISRFGPDPVLLSNRAQCWIKAMNWQNAKDDAELGLKQKCPPKIQIKLLFRKGVALRSMGMYLDAERSFLSVLQLDPDNTEAIRELEILRSPKTKKLKISNNIVIPLEVVDVLPVEFQQILIEDESVGIKAQSVTNQLGEATNGPRAAYEEVYQELFPSKEKSVLKRATSLPNHSFETNLGIENILREILDLKRLKAVDKETVWRNLNLLDIDSFYQSVSQAGVTSTFLEFLIAHITSLHADDKEAQSNMVSKLLAIADLPRFGLELLLCDSRLTLKLKQYLEEHGLSSVLSSGLQKQLLS